ncbi:MAG: CarboxypepD reg-like domain, partial [Bacteroidota bacterium]
MKMKKNILLLICSIIIAVTLHAKNYSLTSTPIKNSAVVKGAFTGKITDVKTGKALTGASIYITDIKSGTSSDNEGNYTL